MPEPSIPQRTPQRNAQVAKLSAKAAAVVGILAVVVVLWTGFRTNAYGQYFDAATGAIHWGYCLKTALLGFGAFFIVSWGMIAALLKLLRSND